ncbi:putative ribulokinase [Helianthus annuus]|uniref:Ribulokinase n=1 Tax=Helianthus annuus TaxID=4232 RepID=A0A9K3I663_HELAN|nr:putative ribulokinase [Helianthus annuus]KAJ0893039.1 putative ribulokinase [Helianthus annuus]
MIYVDLTLLNKVVENVMFCLGLVVDLCSRIHLIIFCKEESKEMIVSFHAKKENNRYGFICLDQSSTDTWLAICTAVKRALSLSDVAGEEVIGIGFAATCSLVAVDSEGQPVSVSWSGDTRRNVIVWMDHRAVKQAERINSFSSPVLQYCGGSISPEMQPPKGICKNLGQWLGGGWTLAVGEIVCNRR